MTLTLLSSSGLHWYYLYAHLLIVLAFFLRIIWVRRPPGVSLAWILIVTTAPIIGLLAYFMVGERPIGRDRSKRIKNATHAYENLLNLLTNRYPKTETLIDTQFRSMAHLAEYRGGIPAVPGNRIDLYPNAQSIFKALVKDINVAMFCCSMEFYIWSSGGMADQVAEALIRAAKRNVRCRILLDELGSAAFWKTKWPGKLREAGIELTQACTIHPLKMQFGRADLRLHRKIVTIDHKIAWAGSLNLVDPAFFKQNAGAGEWVDAMVRLEGNAAESLEMVFEGDWAIENNLPDFGGYLEKMQSTTPQTDIGNVIAQAVPSGPSYRTVDMSQILLSAILDAKFEVMMTTPYFVPDDAVLQGLSTAAGRGVEVTLIVPEHVDSKLVRYASRSYMDDLLEAGVKIQQYKAGLLHTKSMVIDQSFSLFGSVNLDMRSLRLNYEISLLVYDKKFSQQLRALQDQYLSKCTQLDLNERKERSLHERLLENAAQLMSPLL